MSVVVETGSRVHMGLIDLGRCTPNAYGGVGFGTSEPKTVVRAERATTFAIHSFQKLDSAQQEHVDLLVARLSRYYPRNATRFQIEQVVPAHIGLGSSTSLLLAMIEAFDQSSGAALAIPAKQQLSGRGGTSGIGINSFYYGGVVRDAGRPWTEVPEIRPSRGRLPITPPTMLAHLEFPHAWAVTILLMPGKRMHGNIEEAFFNLNTPLPCSEVRATQSIVDDLIVPAFDRADFDLLRSGTIDLAQVGFKRREICNQAPQVQSLLLRIGSSSHLSGGLSSFGPAVYVIARADDQKAESEIESLVLDFQTSFIRTGITTARDRPRNEH
jgi:beta-ribofuranosylaminobenzene 5'-phosphate synthase